MVQPHLPKYLASHFKLISLKEGGLETLSGRGFWSKNTWKYLDSCFSETLVLVGSIKLAMEIPESTHLVNREKYKPVLISYLGENVLKQVKHLYL